MQIIERKDKLFVRKLVGNDRAFQFPIKSKVDYLEFIKFFGEENFDMYPKLRRMKEDGELTWKEVRNIKINNLVNNSLIIPKLETKDRLLKTSILRFDKSMQRKFKNLMVLAAEKNSTDTNISSIIEFKSETGIFVGIQKGEVVALIEGEKVSTKVDEVLLSFNLAPDKHLKASITPINEMQSDYLKELFDGKYNETGYNETLYFKATRIDKATRTIFN